MRALFLVIFLLPWVLQPALSAATAPPTVQAAQLAPGLAEPLWLIETADPKRVAGWSQTPVQPGDGTLSDHLLPGTPPRLHAPGSRTPHGGRSCGREVARRCWRGPVGGTVDSIL